MAAAAHCEPQLTPDRYQTGTTSGTTPDAEVVPIINRDDLPPTPDWQLPARLNLAADEAMPLLYEGDQA